MQNAPAAGTSSRPEAAAAAADPAAAATAADGAAAAAAASSSISSTGIDSLSVLTSTEPIDRLRYQALLMFDHWDSSSSGRLSGEQLGQFFTWCTRKVRVWSGVADPGARTAARGLHTCTYTCLMACTMHTVAQA